ncbi:MAG: DegV family protein [Coriobacteriaceae bacterium]|jgi:DegV family protein with EDD domain|nr:DegV family protein [Coriobacteriaceae bacterium]
MIKIVTDSVASIPADMLREGEVEVVSLYVNHDGVEHVDASMDVDAFYADIYQMVDNIPTSSQPSQHVLEECFHRIAQAGDTLLGIFVSSGLSGTFDGVARAARCVKKRISDFEFALIDSHSCGFDEAWPVLRAATVRKSGRSLRECVEAALSGIRSSRFLFTPETLTFLQKGGRIGTAAALIGNIIKLSPVLTVIDGKAAPLATLRSRKKALSRIVAEFRSDVEHYGLKNLAVHYIGDKTPALEWAHQEIEPLVLRPVRVIPVSPVVGMHVGPAIGIAYECEREMPHKFPGMQPSLVYGSR